MRQVNLETFLRQVRKTKVDSCHLREVVDEQIRYTIKGGPTSYKITTYNDTAYTTDILIITTAK